MELKLSKVELRIDRLQTFIIKRQNSFQIKVLSVLVYNIERKLNLDIFKYKVALICFIQNVFIVSQFSYIVNKIVHAMMETRWAEKN